MEFLIIPSKLLDYGRRYEKTWHKRLDMVYAAHAETAATAHYALLPHFHDSFNSLSLIVPLDDSPIFGGPS